MCEREESKKREHMYTYDADSLPLWQKPTQHGKAIIFQLKIDKLGMAT